jgi:hypothetical protein
LLAFVVWASTGSATGEEVVVVASIGSATVIVATAVAELVEATVIGVCCRGAPCGRPFSRVHPDDNAGKPVGVARRA